MKVVCIVQARIGSSRLPGKVLKKIQGKTILEHCIDRLKRVRNIDEIIIATTTKKIDSKIVDEANRLGVKSFRGSEEDVLSRYYLSACESSADVVVRVTSDCPLIDSEITESIVEYFLENYPKYDYVSNTLDRTYPRGLDTEVFSIKSLKEAYNQANMKFEREHVTPFIWDSSNAFNIYQYRDKEDNSSLRLTLDTKEDLQLITAVYSELYNQKSYFGLESILELFNKKQDLININKEVQQKNIK